MEGDCFFIPGYTLVLISPRHAQVLPGWNLAPWMCSTLVLWFKPRTEMEGGDQDSLKRSFVFNVKITQKLSLQRGLPFRIRQWLSLAVLYSLNSKLSPLSLLTGKTLMSSGTNTIPSGTVTI